MPVQIPQMKWEEWVRSLQITLPGYLQRTVRQLNLLSDGKLEAVNYTATTVPTTGTAAQGDVLRNSNPTDDPTGVLYGWLCVVGGSPGTWVELRFGATGGASDTIYDIAGMYNGLIPASEAVLRLPAVRDFTLPVDLAGSYAECAVAATADAIFDINVEGTTVGTIEFPAGELYGVFLLTTAVDVLSGELLEILGPASQDTTLEGISFCIKAEL